MTSKIYSSNRLITNPVCEFIGIHKDVITHEKLDLALAISAFLVKKFGDAYLSIFQRLESEREVFLRNEADRKKAFELAQKIERNR